MRQRFFSERMLAFLSIVSVGAVEFFEMKEHEIRPDHYIVVYHPHLTLDERNIHMTKHQKLASQDPLSEIHNLFNIGNLSGYTGRFSKEFLTSQLEDSMSLQYIQRDVVVKIDAPLNQRVKLNPKAGFDNRLEHNTQNVQTHPPLAPTTFTRVNGSAKAQDTCYEQSSAVWGLTRTSQHTKSLNGNYYFDSEGEGVKAYIIDTGVYTGHSQFNGRASFGASFTGETHKSDKNGHGTHCAGTIGSETYGIAKKVELVGVQVLSSTGSGYMSWVINGIDWVCDDHKDDKDNKCVVNLSLGGGYYSALNQAVNELVKCGCTVAVAAGNENSNACSSSPASAEDAISVGATDNLDQRAYFSNYGDCVDVFAPGLYITS